MKLNNILLWVFVAALFLFASNTIFAAGAVKGVTQNECALQEGAEIIWDLDKHLWVCCIPAGEGLEKCTPITDMKPLKKKGLIALPPRETKTITIEKNSAEN